MRGDPSPSRQFPRVPNDRRVAAFAIDFGVASIIGSLGGRGLAIPLYLLGWWGLRVLLVANNHGQSVGRWALDMKVVDTTFRVPRLLELTRRESVTGLGSMLIFLGLIYLSPSNGWILVAPFPLLVDCGTALLDQTYRQAWHDRLAGTIVVQTRRGYSLDIKVKKLVGDFSKRVK